jgi:hypothetical protein
LSALRDGCDALESASFGRFLAAENCPGGYGAERGHFYPPILASRIVSYVAALAQIKLDCECTYHNLRESIYPIDATQENLNQVAEDAPDLQAIAEWEGSGPVRYSDDPALLVIAPNSD